MIFIFTLLCGASKAFMKALQAFIKPFEAPQRHVKIKIQLNFFSLSRIETGRVNIGSKSRLSWLSHVQLQSWLIPGHCVSHKNELAVKDTPEAAGFTHVDYIYLSIFYLLKNSSATKSDVQEVAKWSLCQPIP